MHNGVCTVTAIFDVRDDSIEAFREIVAAVTAPSRAEDGCIDYRWSQSHDAPRRFLLYMNWRDRSAFDRHVQSEHVQAAERRIAAEGLRECPEVTEFWQLLDKVGR